MLLTQYGIGYQAGTNRIHAHNYGHGKGTVSHGQPMARRAETSTCILVYEYLVAGIYHYTYRATIV